MSLLMPSPENVEMLEGGVAFVESDVFNMAERIREIDPALKIVAMPEGARHRFVIQHDDRTGKPYYVLGANELDARIIEDLQYILHVPHDKRFAEAERREALAEKHQHQNELDELTERIGLPMQHDLEKFGFLDSPRRQQLAKSSRAHQRSKSARPE